MIHQLLLLEARARIKELEGQQKKDLADVERFRDMARQYMDKLHAIQVLVDEQANDGGIWTERSIHEAYVIKELRRLHYVIEKGDI